MLDTLPTPIFIKMINKKEREQYEKHYSFSRTRNNTGQLSY